MTPILYFRLGDMLGFTASKLANQQQGFSIPIRELMQNSLDASREAENEVCEVEIHIESISPHEIPCFSEYKRVLKQATTTQKEIGSYQNQQSQIVQKIQNALRQSKIPILTFVDNGVGLSQEKLEALLSERSHKVSDNSSGGSYGVGHLSAYSLSSLRYVLYTSRSRKGVDKSTSTIFTGSPILAGHWDSNQSQRGPVGRIVAEFPTCEKNPDFEYINQPPQFLENKVKNIKDTGTIVSILGLTEEWSEEAVYAIASHFFYAIEYGSLKVTVYRENTDPLTIRDNYLRQCLYTRRDGKNAWHSRGDILSGQATWNSYLTVVESKNQKKIELSNGNKVHVYITSSKEFTTSSVALIRSDMLVARHDCMVSTAFDKLRKDPDILPFTIVIDVDKQIAPDLFDLIKKAEGPYHNSLASGALIEEDEKQLRLLLDELCREVKNSHLEKVNRDGFHLPLFMIQGSGQFSERGRNSTVKRTRTAKPIRTPLNTPYREKPGIRPNPRPPNVDFPMISSRRLDAQISARQKYTNGHLVAELQIMPNNTDAKDNTWISFCLSEDRDNSVGTPIWLKVAKITVNNEPKEIDKTSQERIKLGSLKKGVIYKVRARLKVPQQRPDSFKFAVDPVLVLRRK